jgi:nucleotide-binding universal stress UspA family protein
MAPPIAEAEHRGMEPGGTLLVAVARDERARGLIVCARRWAAATGLRPRFLHARSTAGANAPAAPARLGLTSDELVVVAGEPAAAVLEHVRAADPALVLVASSSAYDGRVGSVCTALLRGARAPVAVLPPGGEGAFSGGPIACAVSLGHAVEAAVRFAGALASASGRRLTLTHVVGAKDAARLAAARMGGSLDGDPGEGLPPRPLAHRLVELACEAQADALVVATRAHDAAPDGLLGAAARRLWTAAPCPVVVVRA